ncbi:MAG: hypothetical protein LVT47_14170 [Cyanobacteria bacterium LVE1205-1]
MFQREDKKRLDRALVRMLVRCHHEGRLYNHHNPIPPPEKQGRGLPHSAQGGGIPGMSVRVLPGSWGFPSTWQDPNPIYIRMTICWFKCPNLLLRGFG